MTEVKTLKKCKVKRLDLRLFSQYTKTKTYRKQKTSVEEKLSHIQISKSPNVHFLQNVTCSLYTKWPFHRLWCPDGHFEIEITHSLYTKWPFHRQLVS